MAKNIKFEIVNSSIGDVPRAKLINDLISEISGDLIFPGFTFMFCSNLFEELDKEDITDIILDNKEDPTTILVLDVDIPPPYTEFQILCMACSDILIAPCETLADDITAATGQEVFLLETFLDPSTLYIPDTKKENPRIGWYGSLEDRLSVMRDVTVHGLQIKNTHKNLDVVYLPPAYTVEGEDRRYEKVMHSIQFGRFVIASGIPFAYQGSYREGIDFYNSRENIDVWISHQQELLLELHGKENTLRQLTNMFTTAPKSKHIVDQLNFN